MVRGVGTHWISAAEIGFELDSTFVFWHQVSHVCWPTGGSSNTWGQGTYSVRSDRRIILNGSGAIPDSVRYVAGRVELVWDGLTEAYQRSP